MALRKEEVINREKELSLCLARKLRGNVAVVLLLGPSDLSAFLPGSESAFSFLRPVRTHVAISDETDFKLRLIGRDSHTLF